MRRHPQASPTRWIGRTAGNNLPSRRFLVLTALTVALLLAAVLAGAAQAATVYRPTGGTFAEPGSGAGEIPGYGPVAVDDATGDVLISDLVHQSINVYVPEGAAATFLESFALPEGGEASGMSIDESNRSLYVSNGRLGRIEKFTIGGTGPLTFTPDATFTSPTQGSGPGEIGSFASSLAIDPASGDLLVGDAGNQRVSRFSATGSFISSFNGSDSTAGVFHSLSSVAVAPDGDIYAVDLLSNIYFPGGSSVLERFKADGTADNSFSPALETPSYVAVDQNSGNVLVIGRSGGGVPGNPRFPVRLYTLKGSVAIDEVDFTAGSEDGLVIRGIAIQGGGEKRMYVATEAGGFGIGVSHVKVFESLLAADVTLAAPEHVTARTADLAGTINPLGEPTSYFFEYSREGGPPLKTDMHPDCEGNSAPVCDGTNPVAISGHLEGLVANSDYEVRLVAENPNVAISSRPQSIHTQRSAPEVITGEVSNSTGTSASLTGSVNPFGEQTTYYFEYGTSASYGARVPANGASVAGGGRNLLRVSEELVGLQSGTTYHYRIVATNATGVAQGEDRTFTTQPVDANARVYELVTPAEKDSTNAWPYWMHATPSGNAIAFTMRTVIPGLGKSAPIRPRYTATRAGAGWQVVGLDPLLAPFHAGTAFFYTFGVSEDGTKAVVGSTAALAPGGVSGATNLYLFDIATGSYRTIATTPGVEALNQWSTTFGKGSEVVIGGTANFSRIFLWTEALPFPLLEGVNGPATYEWSSAGLRLVVENSEPAASVDVAETRGVSEDGSVVYVRTEGNEIYAQVNGDEDIEVSGPSPASGSRSEFIGASADGSVAYYVYGDSSERSVYRFDLASRSSSKIFEGVGQESAIGVSATGDYVYFVRDFPLQGLFVWHDGESHLIAPGGRPEVRRVSENGRYFLFSSSLPLTGYDSEGREELFRYDAVSEEIVCASCRTDGGRPRGAATVGLVFAQSMAQLDLYIGRYVLNDGEVFFNSPDPLVPADINSTDDVYSFNGRRQTLISSGTGNSESLLGDVSRDGKNVFFSTAARLVKADKDDSADVYDARVGGGIPGQEVEAEGPGCSGGGCRAIVTAAAAPPPSGSESGAGQAGGTPRRSCPPGKHSVTKVGKRQCVNKAKKRHPRKKGQRGNQIHKGSAR